MLPVPGSFKPISWWNIGHDKVLSKPSKRKDSVEKRQLPASEERLSNDVLKIIFSFLSGADLHSVSQVNKRWRKLVLSSLMKEFESLKEISGFLIKNLDKQTTKKLSTLDRRVFNFKNIFKSNESELIKVESFTSKVRTNILKVLNSLETENLDKLEDLLESHPNKSFQEVFTELIDLTKVYKGFKSSYAEFSSSTVWGCHLVDLLIPDLLKNKHPLETINLVSSTLDELGSKCNYEVVNNCLLKKFSTGLADKEGLCQARKLVKIANINLPRSLPILDNPKAPAVEIPMQSREGAQKPRSA